MNALVKVNPLYWLVFLGMVVATVIPLTTQYYFMAIVPPLLLLFVLFLSRVPQFGFYVIIFLVPLTVLRGLTSAYPFLTISKFVGFLLVVIVLFQIIVNKRRDYSFSSKLWPLLFALAALYVVSAFSSDYRVDSIDAVRKLLVVYLIFALTIVFVSKKSFSVTLPAVIVAAVTLSSVLAILGYFFDISIFAMSIEATGRMKRATGGSINPNHFAAMIIFGIPIIVHWFLTGDNWERKMAALALLAINVTAVILTFSRGGGLVLGAVTILLFIEHLRRFRPSHFGAYLLFAAFGLIVVGFVIPPSYWQRQVTVTDTSSLSIGRRISYLYVAYEAFKENPILGTGPGTYKESYARSKYAAGYGRSDDLETFRRPAHNSYIEILIGAGVFAFIAFAALLVLAFRDFHRAKHFFREKGNLKMASLVGAYKISLASLCIYFLFMSREYHKFFWLAIGLSQVALLLAQKEEVAVSDEDISAT